MAGILKEGPIRKRLMLRERKFLKQSSNPGNTEVPRISRKVLVDLTFDEEKAYADYKQLATNPVFNEYQKQLILGIAEDEQRHYRILSDILHALEGEGKVV